MSEGRDVRLHAEVSGRVQGVFYRMFVLQAARGLGLVGQTRNLRDGKVEVIAEGPKGALEKLVGQLRKGPPAAWVEDVSEDWGAAEGRFSGFGIEYD